MTTNIQNILAGEYVEPIPRIAAVCHDIRARHPGRVLGFIYYGSSLRDMEDPDNMLDFYVIVDSYRKTHKNPIRMVLNKAFPPAVYYHEMEHQDGIKTTCKYSIMSLNGFERRCSPSAFLSVTWGRFSQPCVVLYPESEDVYNRIMAARETAIRRMAAQTAPLFDGRATSPKFWARGFLQSYRTELRPESSEGRAEEIVLRYEDRYAAIMTALYGAPDAEGYYTLPAGSKRAMKTKWFFRRLLGKPANAIRVLCSAATFEGGLPYVQHKLEKHSGVRIPVTKSQIKHPVLWSPVLFYKYWRKGAFR
ncbi:MAG: hypothetical protein HKN36_13895 [Hellea sp.]|nr:hypothetical protein [Hellea sp.]